MNALKLAVVGGGPSAFYVASRLLSLLPASSTEGSKLRIHMYDRLWAPHGLVRYGVAPDHPEVKNCTHKFDEAAEDPRFSFFGNVSFHASTPSLTPGTDGLSLPLSSLFKNYTHLLFATGAPTPILHSALPPSERCIPALSMVHWYTNHPAYRQGPPPLDKTEHVTIIGQGNVSLDVARMLLTSPDILAKFDVPENVLGVLRRSAVKHVSIVGRRGPLQAAFTTKELREMTSLTEASMAPIDPDVLTPAQDQQLTRQQGRTLDLLKKGSKNRFGTTQKTWSLEFFRSPTGLTMPSSPSEKPLLTFAHTVLDPEAAHAVPTSHTSSVHTDLVITSLGQRSEPTAPFYDPALGHIRNVSGRVLKVSDQSGHGSEGASVLRNVYASGWAATGAKGVLASTMLNAYATADTILSDYFASTPAASPSTIETIPVSPLPTPPESVGETVMNPEPHPEEPLSEVVQGRKEGWAVTYEDWKRVDQEEKRRGEAVGKERERMSWDEVKELLGSGQQV